MFFDEGFKCFHLCWVEQIDFGNLGDEVGMEFNGVVIGIVRGELVMGLLREDVSEIFTPISYDRFDYSGRLGYLGGDGSLVD